MRGKKEARLKRREIKHKGECYPIAHSIDVFLSHFMSPGRLNEA